MTRKAKLSSCEACFRGILQMWYKIAAELSKADDPLSSPIWEQVKRQFNGEHLAYIAAFAVGATLVFGDRPKVTSQTSPLLLPAAARRDK
jgi:hypothetical protein